jgi:hypothetical protein
VPDLAADRRSPLDWAAETDSGNPILRKQLALARAALLKSQELLRIKDLDLQRSW